MERTDFENETAGRNPRQAVSAAIQSIEKNHSIANMDYANFANSVQADGVCRSLPT